MRLPVVSRARYDAARADADRQRERAEKATDTARTAVFNRRQIGQQLADSTAIDHRLERRVVRLLAVGERILTAYRLKDAEADKAKAVIQDLTDRLLASEERARTADRRAATEARPVDGAAAVSPEVVRLRAELRRSNQARAALDADRAELVHINDLLNRQLRNHAEGSRP